MAEQKERLMTDWSCEETIEFIQNTLGNKNRNDKKLVQSVEYLASTLSSNENIDTLLKSDGIDLIFDVMADTLNLDNINLQKGLCTIFTVICSNPAAKQHPAKKNGFKHLAKQIEKYMNDHTYCVYACNAVCNLCHNSPVHRRFVMNSGIITQVIVIMDTHRGKEGGDKVHESASMAIRNIATTPEGQATVGPAGLKAILDGVEVYYKTAEIVKSSLGVLCNLCALGSNGAAFIKCGALKLWTKIYDDAQNQMALRQGCIIMMNNLSSSKESCVLLAVDEEGLALIIGKMLKDSPPDSPLFANALKAVAALTFTLPKDNKQLKVESMSKMIGAGLLEIFNQTLKHCKDRELQELVATVTVSMVQTESVELTQKVADGHTPEFMVAYLSEPSAQTLLVCMITWLYVVDNYKNQAPLVKAGLIQFMAAPWYVNVKDDTMSAGLSLMLKLTANIKNYDALRPRCDDFDKMADFCNQKGGDIANKCKQLKGDIASVRKSGK